MLRKPTRWVAGVLLFSVAMPAFPWGRQGHRLVALVADDHLSAAARANVKFLLGPETMAGVASFGDDYRGEHPETGSWHFVDIPMAAKAYDRDRDCPAPVVDGQPDQTAQFRDCVVERIPYFMTFLKDPEATKAQKTFALKMVIHLVGDVHQPFHAIGEARGGNSVMVSEWGTTQCGERYKCNLHSLWDEGLLDHRRLNETKYLALLEKDITTLKLDDKPDGTPVAWANASHRAAAAAFVQNGTLIDNQYFNDEIETVDRELEFGGLHLAHLLNAAFTTVPAGMEAPVKREPGEAPKLIPR